MTTPERIRAYLDAIEGDERFLMTVGAGIVDSLLLIFHYIDQGTYAMLTGGTVAAFIGGVALDRKSNANLAQA